MPRKMLQNALELRQRKGWFFTIEHALTVLVLHIKARLAMMFLSPHRWPLFVDQYLLRYAGGFDRTYTYPASFRFRIGPMAAFGHFMNLTKDLPGDIAEFGVYKGGSLVTWAKNVKLMELDKKVYGFDSFEGYPDVAAIDTTGPNLLGQKATYRGGLNETSYEAVQNICQRLQVDDSVRLVKGYYPESFKQYEHLRFCQVLIDCDLYDSHRHVLEYVYPRMVRGGIIMFEEYDDQRFPGARQAIDEFLRDKPETVKVIPELRLSDRPDLTAIAFLVKE